MFTVRTDTKSRKALLAVKKLPGSIQKSLDETFNDLGAVLVRTAQNQALNEAKYGRWYGPGSKEANKGLQINTKTRTKKKKEEIKDDSPTVSSKKKGVTKLHRASASGQSPAVLSGEYFENFSYENRGGKELEFGNSSEYAGYLEEGTEFMDPRTGVLNSVNVSLGTFRTMVDGNIKKAMNLES